MNISVIGRQFSITQAIHGYVVENLKALIADNALKVTSTTVVMGHEKNHFSVTLVLNCKYHTLKAEVSGFDLYRAFDSAIRKVEHQMAVLRDRVHNHRGASLSDMECAFAENYSGE